MRRNLALIMFAGVLGLGPGCATIVGSTVDHVQIDTSPSEAEVSIKNQRGAEVFRGKTPVKVTLKKGLGYFSGADYMIYASKPGYVSKSMPLDRSLSAWYFGNIGFVGLIGSFIVDPATGAMWKLDEHPPQIILDVNANAGAAETGYQKLVNSP